MLCEVLSEFSPSVLFLPCNSTSVSVTSLCRHAKVVFTDKDEATRPIKFFLSEAFTEGIYDNNW